MRRDWMRREFYGYLFARLAVWTRASSRFDPLIRNSSLGQGRIYCKPGPPVQKKMWGPRVPNTIIGLLLLHTFPSVTLLPDCLHSHTQSCHIIDNRHNSTLGEKQPSPPARGLGERCKLLQWGWGGVPIANAFRNHSEHRKRIWRQ